MGERTHKIELRIDADRFLDLITVQTMIDLEGNTRQFTPMANIVKNFVWMDGAYMDPDDALEKYVKVMTIRQLKDTIEQLMKAANEDAVNPPNGTASA